MSSPATPPALAEGNRVPGPSLNLLGTQRSELRGGPCRVHETFAAAYASLLAALSDRTLAQIVGGVSPGDRLSAALHS